MLLTETKEIATFSFLFPEKLQQKSLQFRFCLQFERSWWTSEVGLAASLDRRRLNSRSNLKKNNFMVSTSESEAAFNHTTSLCIHITLVKMHRSLFLFNCHKQFVMWDTLNTARNVTNAKVVNINRLIWLQ